MPGHSWQVDPSPGCQTVLLEPVVAENQHTEVVAATQCVLSHLLNEVGAQVQLLQWGRGQREGLAAWSGCGYLAPAASDALKGHTREHHQREWPSQGPMWLQKGASS